MCQHLIGKNIKHYGADHVVWGTDCLWWGSPQWVIDAFKRFQISDELCEKFGYQKLTKDDKAKIFGLNAAKIYGVDVTRRSESLARRHAEQAEADLPRARAGSATTPPTAGCGPMREEVWQCVIGWFSRSWSWLQRPLLMRLHRRGVSIRRRGDAITSASRYPSSSPETSACSAIARRARLGATTGIN